MTTGALRKTDKGADIVFFPKKGENDAFGSTAIVVANALCKKHEGIVPSRYGKKVTKVI